MRIALVTSETPNERDLDFDFLAPSLRRRGAAAEAPAWSDEGVDWSAYDLALISSTWDYHLRPEQFRDWLARAEAATRLRNSRELVEWNIDKRYLRELERVGVPTIPTIWSEPGNEAETAEAIAERGWGELVIKPVVDLNAERLARVEAELAPRILEALPGPGMVQPYLRSLESEGEYGVLFVAGEPIHSFLKRPAAGDFRVQPLYGGRAEPTAPDPSALEIARAAIAAAPGEPLYARVDLVRGEDRRLRVIELELIEPAFYLEIAPQQSEPVARAILAAAA